MGGIVRRVIIGLAIMGVVLAYLWLLGIIASPWALAPLAVAAAYVPGLPLLIRLKILSPEFGK